MRWALVCLVASVCASCSLARQPLTPGVVDDAGIDAGPPELDAGLEDAPDLDAPDAGGDAPIGLDAPDAPLDAPVVCPPCDIAEVCGPVGACVPRPAPTITTDRASYTRGDPMTITLSGMPGDPQDFIAIAPVGAPVGSYVNWVYTGGITSGTVSWPTVTSGVSPDTSFTIRAFYANQSTQRGESASFFVAF